MIDTYQQFLERMNDYTSFAELADFFAGRLPEAFDSDINGNIPKWCAPYAELPELQCSNTIIDADLPKVSGDIIEQEKSLLLESLHALHPWRKGPFNLFGIHIDAEWRSDWKWNRLKEHITPLKGRNVLDIGCGNGYHCLRMAGAGAENVIGIDNGMLSIIQFKAVNKYFRCDNVEIFPVAIQDMPDDSPLFDTVFSMGVLYHRKAPEEHLNKIRSLLLPGGECVLESLVIDGYVTDSLIPDDRYAQMRNVHKIPSVHLLEKWVRQAGFTNVRTVDVTATTTDEQRSTQWMHFHSLAEFLDPDDPSRTIEGYPAPKRAVVIATG